MKKNKNAKKKRTPTAKLVAKLTPAEKKARAKKLKYVNLKTALEKKGLWKSYLAAKKNGEAGRGGSVALMNRFATQGLAAVVDAVADVEKLPKEIKADAFESSGVAPLVALATRLVAIDKERAAIVAQIKEVIG